MIIACVTEGPRCQDEENLLRAQHAQGELIFPRCLSEFKSLETEILK